MHDQPPTHDLLRASQQAARESRKLLAHARRTALSSRKLIEHTRSQLAASRAALEAATRACDGADAPQSADAR